jgi:DNA modification methylase
MLIQADARALPLVDGSVDCCITSPPYYGLRDYGTGGQIGMESTPDAFVSALVEVFREVRRVMKPSGVLWLNLGDSYHGSWGNSGNRPELDGGTLNQRDKTVEYWKRGGWDERRDRPPSSFKIDGLKPKDLYGIPWRVAFALQADGWYLRSDIIWSKPNPMPESVTDRPTKSHEYLFLLSKSERYWYDAAAIAEPVSQAMLMQMEQGYDGLGLKDYEGAGVQNPSSVKARIIEGARRRQKIGETPGQNPPGYLARGEGRRGDHPTRNKRTVWEVNTQPYIGAHFATMPEKLVEPCILAGCPMGGLVLDPFSGSGTVLAVAERLGRRGVGVDLNPAYHVLAKERTRQRGIRWDDAERQPDDASAPSVNAVREDVEQPIVPLRV